MPIEIKCPECATTLRVPDEHAGKKAKCPQCQAIFVVQPDAGPGLFDSPSAGGTAPPTKDPFASAPPVGNPYSAPVTPQPSSRGGYRTQHRGGMILTFGILAICCNFCCIPGILAWVMGRGDLAQMDSGVMDPEGRGLTQAGMILGMVGTGLAALGILIYVAYIVFIIVVVAAGGAGGL